MKVTITIPDEMLPSITQFIAHHHVELGYDPKSGHRIETPKFDAAGLIEHVVDSLLDTIEERYPSALTAEIRAEEEALKARKRDAIRGKKRKP